MKRALLVFIFTIAVAWIAVSLSTAPVLAAEPIIIGVPTSLGFPTGDQCLKAVKIAVDEINAKGGVKVGSTKRPLKIVTMDLRDAEPGVPVPEALLGLEKIILDNKVNAILVGPFRSEALLAGMDIIAKHKVPTLCSIAMTPGMEVKIEKNPEKYKYVFRTCFTARDLMKYLAGIMTFLKKEFGFNKVFIFNQDVAWCRKTAELMKKIYFDKAGWEVVGHKVYPTGSSDFASGLMAVRAKGAQVIMPVFDMPQVGVMVKQWKSMKIPALIAGFTGHMNVLAAWDAYDGKIAGAIDTIFEVGSALGAKKVPQSVEFHNKYVKRWNDYPSGAGGHGPAPAYESVYVLTEAIERAGSLDPDAIVTELEKTDRKGVMGRVRFNKNHQVPYGTNPDESSVGCVIQWNDKGERIVVYPESIAEGKIKLPEGLKAAK